MLAEDMVRTALKATCSVSDRRSRAELETRLTYRLITLGMTPSWRRNSARRKVETILDTVERLSRAPTVGPAVGSAGRPAPFHD